MPDPQPETVAFGLAQPLRVGLRRLGRRPAATLLPVLVLLVPAALLAAVAVAVLRGGADDALTDLIAGAPADAPGAVIVRPDAHDVRLLLLLGTLLALVAAAVLLAGVVAGAVDRTAAAGPRVLRAVQTWPVAAVVALGVALAAVLAVAAVVVLASLAGRVRFQLTAVVLLLGLGGLAVVLLRLTLAPATAVAHGLGPVAAIRRTWRDGRGELLRLTLAAVVLVVAVALPAVVLWFVVSTVLDALADAEVLGLSPVAIGLWALAPAPVAVLVGVTAWGAGARDLVDALDARTTGDRGAPAGPPTSDPRGVPAADA